MGFLDIIVSVFGSSDSDADWFCDSCGVYMNDQPGFNTRKGIWTCTKCGCKNDVSKNNLFESEVDHDMAMMEVINDEDSEAGGSPEWECPNCGGDLAGGEFVAPWEDGDNSSAYVRCPHCGYKRLMYDDD